MPVPDVRMGGVADHEMRGVIGMKRDEGNGLKFKRKEGKGNKERRRKWQKNYEERWKWPPKN